MKKHLIFTLAAMLIIGSAYAQEFKLAKTDGKLVIKLRGVTVEGYNGNEIIFTSSGSAREDNERTKGLKPINVTGFEDNTGFGISVTEKGNNVEVNAVHQSHGRITIKVPRNMAVSFSHHQVMHNERAIFKNLDGELEVSVSFNEVHLQNVKGPVTANTVHGSIEAKFTDNIKSAVSLVSGFGTVDVEIPESTRADLSMNSSHGEILASSDLKIEFEKSAPSGMLKISNHNVRGKLNGGGPNLILRSDWGRIYLRKK
jgi:hypothetical protein